MRVSTRLRAISTTICVLACIPVAAASANSFDPVVRETAVGRAEADQALLTQRDLGSGWTSVATGLPSPSLITCPQRKPDDSSLVETGIAMSSFDHGPALNVTDSVRVYETTREADAAHPRSAGPSLVACDEQYLRQAGDHVTGVARIGLSGSGTDATGYRIAATVARPPLIGRAPALILRTYNDLVLLSKGKVSEFVMFSALLTPPSRAFEDRTARALLDQLGVRAA